jgi:TonB family protein
MKRWVQFELSQAEPMENPLPGKPITLTIMLGGVTAGKTPVVAISESNVFHTQRVTLEPDAESPALKGSVTLDPIQMSRTSVPPKAARIQVTFARSRQDTLEPFMRRIVYVTLGSERSEAERDKPPGDVADSPGENLILGERKPPVAPVLTCTVIEEDLVPAPPPEEAETYWQQVSHLISRSWTRQIRGIRHAPSNATVKVHFKLFPNGRAQLIEIEKGSGLREIDEAGIHAVINAQPFVPVPSELEKDTVDVHVSLQTGNRGRSREVQVTGNQSYRK